MKRDLLSISIWMPIRFGTVMCGKEPSETWTRSSYEGDDPEECSDGADNDRNGLFDCKDPGCAKSHDCRDAKKSSDENGDTTEDTETDTDTESDTVDESDRDDDSNEETDRADSDAGTTDETSTDDDTDTVLADDTDSGETEHPDAGKDSSENRDSDSDMCRSDVIEATIRDFSVDHPDFQVYDGYAPTTGLLENELGPDGKPVLRSNSGTRDGTGTELQMTSADTFDQWYRDVPDVNYTFSVSLPLTQTSEGVMTYENNTFFPISPDDGWGAEMDDYPEDNFFFTTEIHLIFTYREGQSFSFYGDDDLWIFIDGILALDIGGVHPQEAGTIMLDDFASRHGLRSGHEYRMAIFHAERRIAGSHFRVDTNIECFTPAVII